jgi:hypothetical protein
MRSKESTPLPTTVEDLTKLVRRIVGEALQSTAAFCRQMDELPTTGDEFLDKALDDLDPVAQAAIVALLRQYGKDERIDLGLERLEARIATFENPDQFWIGFAK